MLYVFGQYFEYLGIFCNHDDDDVYKLNFGENKKLSAFK